MSVLLYKITALNEPPERKMHGILWPFSVNAFHYLQSIVDNVFDLVQRTFASTSMGILFVARRLVNMQSI